MYQFFYPYLKRGTTAAPPPEPVVVAKKTKVPKSAETDAFETPKHVPAMKNASTPKRSGTPTAAGGATPTSSGAPTPKSLTSFDSMDDTSSVDDLSMNVTDATAESGDGAVGTGNSEIPKKRVRGPGRKTKLAALMAQQANHEDFLPRLCRVDMSQLRNSVFDGRFQILTERSLATTLEERDRCLKRLIMNDRTLRDEDR